MSKDPPSMSKYKPRGIIRYYPFEHIDDMSRREVFRFRVTPFGHIQESFFKYEFRLPGEDTVYTVMWDYNIGLVRMTPFFKCCKYSKTIPAKMLGLNPGLKDITHSITGGAIAAQGYWMPYDCAKAVCATFCYNIAGALIPIFGPTFPSLCIPPGSPDYARMVIDPRIVEESIRDADLSRKVHQHGFSAGPGPLPSIDRRAMRPLREDRRLRLNTRLMSPYSDDGDGPRSCPDSASSNGSDGVGYSYGFHAAHAQRHPLPPTSSWTPANRAEPYRLIDESHRPPHPYLSAVPRFTPLNRQTTSIRPLWAPKRPIDEEGAAGRDSSESNHGSSPALSYASQRRQEEEPDTELAEQNAALGLMTLRTAPRKEPGYLDDADSPDGHRSKRRRATSA
ncbi:Transcriptional repressor XBP1 [Colletotrichum spinosum]|uniref:Transcriptional repressor XBP1 n=1 Tax=Colletotrichum spinosum TaxID=1347390 RepID=A0A4R8Q0L2_9PEZI|nr:Transcriptional repressor XBP1 [Colletotrichum spinosum]